MKNTVSYKKSISNKAIVFILLFLLLLIGGTSYWLFFRMRINNTQFIIDEIRERYGASIVAVDLAEDKRMIQVDLSLQNPQTISIKHEIEEKYRGRIVFRLFNFETESIIVTAEEQEAAKREPVFRYQLYESCKLIQIGDINNFRIKERYNVNAQIDETISFRLRQFPILVPIEKEFVEENDLLKISYRVFDETREYVNVAQETVRCGKVNFDSLIEESVKGKRIGQAYTIKYNNNLWSATTLQCEIVPLFCYYVEDAVANDEFARKHTQYQSMQEWREALKQSILAEKKEELWNRVLSKIIETSTFLLDEDYLTKKAADLYVAAKLMAGEFGLNPNDLVEEIYHGSAEDFILSCYANSKEIIQEYLIITVIAKYASLSVSTQELEELCVQNGDNLKQMEEDQIKELAYLVLREKVKNYMVDVAVE